MILILSDCKISRQYSETAKSFTYCFNNEYTGLDTLINLNGLYYLIRPGSIEKPDNQIDLNTEYPICAFFKNGLFVYNPSKDLLNIINKETKPKISGNWGIYKIENNIIKAQFVSPLGQMSWTKGEGWFRILDRNNLEVISFVGSGTIQEKDTVKNYSKPKGKYIYHFIKFENLIEPEIWLKEEKWFWCNESEYLDYKKQTRN
ncbi:MAG: hypothetical protein A2W99_07310 [Bacteroidetes bacterium GWF2_33_16]|nr:MAG: hypothetical protein A2X00_10260 [Bacteroidetes bacterium GWE2_32_14]OFY03018.1 MAG: hypothetical protein A2W99_07310 [Bacteroidetes bacterium GWF2_33_16]